MMKKVHFIAIGGSAMHNLALALHDKGLQVTGSDDIIYEPSRSRLEKEGLLPAEFGWFPEKITPDLDAVIVGMHARPDNPELLKALELNLPVYSYPEFLYEQSKNKTRIVVAGSHGKTTTTSMLIHAAKKHGINTDFMVGSLLKGFDRMIKLTEDAPFIILEGDEYPTSPLDPRPKFQLYQPHHAIITGIALDHINKFENWDVYTRLFENFIETIEPGGSLAYFEEDERLKKITEKRKDIEFIPYGTPEYIVRNNTYHIIFNGKEYPLKIFGRHNMQNIEGASKLAGKMGIPKDKFLTYLADFEGASLRLEKIYEDDKTVIIRDFAHAPSKVKASVEAVREMYPDKKLLAVLELHTYSSLNKKFIPEYKGSLQLADEAVVFYSPEAIRIKKLEKVPPGFIYEQFGKENLKVIDTPDEFLEFIYGQNLDNTVLLLMSSGNLADLDLEKLKPQGHGHQRLA